MQSAQDIATLPNADAVGSGASYLATRGSFTKCLLLFSGGLDTSCMAKWIAEEYGCEVYTLTVDVGQREDFAALERRAYSLGAQRHFFVNAQKELAEEYCWPALRANAVVGRHGHPLSSSLTRPLITRIAVEIATAENIPVIAHGASGKANDSLRIDTTVLTLGPHLKVLAPVREWGMSRQAELRYAQEHGIAVEATADRIYSVDDNLWARETESGVLDSTGEPAPDGVFSLVAPLDAASADPQDVTLGFEDGVPTSLNGAPMSPLPLIRTLNEIGASHGIGRFDCLEDRGIGVKVREIHEAPAAAILLAAHSDLQSLVSTREEARLSQIVELQWVESALNGFWHTPLMEAMNLFLGRLHRRVCGEIVVRLHKGNVTVLSRRSPFALDLQNLVEAHYIERVNERATAPFIEVAGLQQRASYWLESRDGVTLAHR